MKGRRMLSPLHAIAALAMMGGLTPPDPPPRRGRRLELEAGPGEPNHVLEIPLELTTRGQVIAFVNGHTPRTGWRAVEGDGDNEIRMMRVTAEQAVAGEPKQASQRERDDAYHRHLDVCEQCIRNPFGLCPAGDALLKATGPIGDQLAAAVAQVEREHHDQHVRDRMARAEAKRERKRRARAVR